MIFPNVRSHPLLVDILARISYEFLGDCRFLKRVSQLVLFWNVKCQPLLDILEFGSLESRTSFLGGSYKRTAGQSRTAVQPTIYTQFSRIFSLTLLILHGSVFVTSHQASSHTATEDGGGSLILHPGIHPDDDLADLSRKHDLPYIRG